VSTDVESLVDDLSELARRTLPELVDIEIDLESDLRCVVVDPHQLENALLNLVLNARDALPDGGTIRLTARNWSGSPPTDEDRDAAPDGIYVLISVEDDGAGIPADVIDKVFEPFFTTKEVGKGSGLGLPMVYGFVKQSGGQVELDSASGRGTRVSLYLPAADAVEMAEETRSSVHPETSAGSSELVLVVEDDQEVREVVCRMLEDQGYRFRAVADAHAGLALIRADPEIALLLSDVTLPKRMSGVELARRAMELRPDLAVLLMSGYTGDGPCSPSMTGFDGHLIHKPFRTHELATMIRNSLDRVAVTDSRREPAAIPAARPGA
jgi:CheY-like chemotaxis protein